MKSSVVSSAFAAALSLAGIVAAFAPRDAAAEEKTYKFALSLGWTEGESGQHLDRGYRDAVASLGGELTVADASYDAKRQSDQIDAFVQSKPDALFVTASDPAAIAPAVKRAIDAGIPVFAADSLIPGVAVTSTAMSNNFGMGEYSARFIAEQLGGKGKIALVDLPANETWDLRAHGLRWALRQYPEIEIVGTWSYNSTGATTPRAGVESLLTAHPDIQAIWSDRYRRRQASLHPHQFRHGCRPVDGTELLRNGAAQRLLRARGSGRTQSAAHHHDAGLCGDERSAEGRSA